MRDPEFPDVPLDDLTTYRSNRPIAAIYDEVMAASAGFNPNSDPVVFAQAETVTGFRLPRSEQTPEVAKLVAALMYRDRQTGLSSFEHYLLEVANDILEKNNAAQVGIDVKPSSIVFCDLNHFKNYNTEIGQRTTDFLLVAVSHQIKEAVRESIGELISSQIRQKEQSLPDEKNKRIPTEDKKSHHDIVARRSGDEFLVFMPDCLAEDANKRMEEIAKDVAKKTFLIKDDFGQNYKIVNVTLAHGVLEIPTYICDRLGGGSETVENYSLKLRQAKLVAEELVDQCEEGMKEKKRAMKAQATPMSAADVEAIAIAGMETWGGAESQPSLPNAPGQKTTPTITKITPEEAETLKTQENVVVVNLSEKQRAWASLPKSL